MCRSVLKVSEDIIFVGVVDASGKLLVGESSSYSMPTKNCSYCQNAVLYGFFSSWLVDIVQNTGCDVSCFQACNKVHFALSRFRGTSLIVASLAQEKSFYLCIHMHKSSLEQELNIIYTTIDSILC